MWRLGRTKRTIGGNWMQSGNEGLKKKLTLYARDFCYWSERVIQALDLLNLHYEIRSVPHKGGREEVIRLTGQEEVPVLVDDGIAIHDSTRILEHLKRKYSRDE